MLQSRSVRPLLALSVLVVGCASPVMITLPAVVVGNGLPPGSVDRSKVLDVAQPTTSTESASRGRTERDCSMENLSSS